MSADVRCPGCDGPCALYSDEAAPVLVIDGNSTKPIVLDVPGAIPEREVPPEDAVTICARCRRTIPACLDAGVCGRERAS